MSECEHFVQLYENGGSLLRALTDYARDALASGEAAVVIAAPERLSALGSALTASGIDVKRCEREGRLIAADANDVLGRFMVDGWPDDERFAASVGEMLQRARGGRRARKVRAFGEMVALLWDRGYHAATFRLEHLWHGMCQDKAFRLFCAYPKAAVAAGGAGSLDRVVSAHSRVLSG